MIPILNARQMRAADRAAIRSGVASRRLMENAAIRIVEEILDVFPGWRRVVVACGPGNNGGDGLAAARLLAGRGRSISLFTLRDPDSYRGDPAENASRARAAGLELVSLAGRRGEKAFRRALREADGVLDALFGTGLARRLAGTASRVIAAMNRSGKLVVAADLPSGLSSDGGEVLGPCVRADLTVALAAPKHCHVFFPARERCGQLRVADIGIAAEFLWSQERRLALLEFEDVRALLPPRAPDSHKGTFGRVAVIAGSRGKAGAAILAARGALRTGAGLVTVFCPQSLEETVVAALPEAMTHGLPEEEGRLAAEGAENALEALKSFDAAVAGPGLSTAPGTVKFLRRIVKEAKLPLVCDADFLNAFARRPGVFFTRIVTPHPGEAARLLGISTRRVQADRVAAARKLAKRSEAIVLLKGASSLTATSDGDVTVNPTGTPLLATAGAGDVLAGAIGALVAGGMDEVRAVEAAAYLHGKAGEILAERFGDAGLLAADLADALPLARRALHAGDAAIGKQKTGNGKRGWKKRS